MENQNDGPLDLFAEELADGGDLSAEELPTGNAFSSWSCLFSFTSASCPGSTAASVSSFSSS